MKAIIGTEEVNIKSIYEEQEYSNGASQPVLRLVTSEPLTKAQLQALCTGPVVVDMGDDGQRQYGQYDAVTECAYTLTRQSEIEKELTAVKAERDTLKAENVTLKAAKSAK